MKPSSGRTWKIGLIVGLTLLAIGVASSMPRVADPPAYFDFADRRTLIGISNFMDVVSNAPWAVIGVLGLLFVARQRNTGPGSPFTENWERIAFSVLFAAMGLVAVGSARFHLAPAPDNLFWDRVPITIIFMCFFALMIGERISLRAGRLLFLPLLAIGTSSVVYWQYTQATGRGDLRWYLLVQLFPILVIPLLFLLFPPRYTGTGRLLAALSLYALAKVFEFYDERVFAMTRIISGHTLKHLTGALAAWCLLRTVRLRQKY